MGKSLLGETLGAYSGTLGKCSAVREPHSVSPWDGVRLVLLLEEGFEHLKVGSVFSELLVWLCSSCL